MFERFARNRRRSGGSEFVEVTPDVRRAERKPDVAPLGQLTVAGIAIDLQNSFEALQMGVRPLGRTHPISAVLSDGWYFAKRVTLSLALRSSSDAGRGFGRVGGAAALVAG